MGHPPGAIRMPDLNAALRALTEFAENLKFETEPPSSFLTSEALVMLSSEEGAIFIRGDDSEKYGESVQQVFDAVSKAETISRDSVERLINDFLLKLAKEKRE